MKRVCAALCTALMLFSCAAAEEKEKTKMMEKAEKTEIVLYVAQGAMERETARELTRLLGEAFEQGAFSLVYGEEAGGLRRLVMEDHAPQVAVCPPEEAMPWAAEGMLAPLDGRVPGLERMQTEVVEACVMDETLYLAPVAARHRRFAVNARLIHEAGMGALLDAYTYPVWHPSQLGLLLEELQMREIPAMDVWTAGEDDALAAFAQALYGSELTTMDGAAWHGASPGLRSALAWLEEMTDCGLVGVCRDREAALERFLAGETAMFIGWEDGDARRYHGQLDESGVELVEMDFPSSTGLPVRAFELTAAAAFIGRDARQTALAMEVSAFIAGDERALALIGGRRIWKDGALWLRCPGADSRSATLSAGFSRLMRGVLLGEETPESAAQAFAALALALP